MRRSTIENMAMFSTRRLGKSTLELTPIGLGAWAIGGEWRFGWGHQDDAESIATIKRAVALGLNWIDTAAIYGLGHSEEVVGRALQDIPRSERPYVFTKCSLVWDDAGATSHSLRAQSIRRGRAEPETVTGRANRSLSDSLAGVAGESRRATIRATIEEAWGDADAAARRREGGVHRRVELRRGPDGADLGEVRPDLHRVPATAVLDDPAATSSKAYLSPTVRRTTSASSSTRRCSLVC